MRVTCSKYYDGCYVRTVQMKRTRLSSPQLADNNALGLSIIAADTVSGRARVE